MGHCFEEHLRYDKSKGVFVEKDKNSYEDDSNESIESENGTDENNNSEWELTEQEYDKNRKARELYHNSIDYQIIKRVQAQIQEHISDTDLEIEELFGCSREFFINWIKYQLKNKEFKLYDLSHVRPVNIFKNKEEAFNWKNYYLLLASENRSIKDERNIDAERKQYLKACNYLEMIFF